MPTSQIMWIMPDSGMPYSGIHKAEVIEGHKWVRVRYVSKKRFMRLHLTKWKDIPHISDTGQTLSEVANSLRLYTKGQVQ